MAGLDVLRHPGAVRRAIGVVAQKSGADREATGRENLILQGQVHGASTRAARARADELLARFGLADAGDRLARTYSGGMARRLDVALGLVHHPQVLFLDEPTTGLDPEVRADMWEEIARLSREEGITILLTTHYLEEADRLAARLAIVERGRVVAEGTPEGLKGELRGDAVQVELAEPGDGTVQEALARLEGVRDVTVEQRTLRARADHGASAVPAVLAALEGRGIRVASVTVARPSLDDVYLRHAGRTFAEAGAMTTLHHSWFMTIRHIRALIRQPIWVFITLVQPLIWLLLYGALFKRVVEIPGFGAGSYLDFLTPGIIVMSALFSSGWSGMALLDDLDRGVLDRFLVSPVSRVSLIAGRLAQGALIVVVQSLILVGWR